MPEFTQPWLQSLTQAIDIPETRQIKPWFERIDSLYRQQAKVSPGQAADEVWEFGAKRGMVSILSLLPTMESEWEFDDHKEFTFRRNPLPSSIETLDQWKAEIGLSDCKIALEVGVLSADWTNFVRREALRQKKTFSSGTATATGMQSIACDASWRDGSWQMTLDGTEWLVVEIHDPFQTARPSVDTIRAAVWKSLEYAETAAKRCRWEEIAVQNPRDWAAQCPLLAELHQEVISSREYCSAVRYAWESAWPIVYREQNILRGQSDIACIREQISHAMTQNADLTIWMFVMAKLLATSTIGSGLGTNGTFR